VIYITTVHSDNSSFFQFVCSFPTLQISHTPYLNYKIQKQIEKFEDCVRTPYLNYKIQKQIEKFEDRVLKDLHLLDSIIRNP